MIYAMSDIHGCYDKYKEMLNVIEFAPEDTLYILGDVLDRGPDGIKILQDMSVRANIFPILGNHEFIASMCLPWLMKEVTTQNIDNLSNVQVAALSDWITNGGSPTLRSLQKLTREEREDILEYLHEMELYVEVEAGGRDFVLVHSGLRNFSPSKSLEDYDLEDFLYCRPEPDTVYYPDRIVVFGHTPTSFLFSAAGEKARDKIFRRDTMIDIDCGCVFPSGRLGCLCLDTMEEFYV